jgi:hypothetical protein
MPRAGVPRSVRHRWSPRRALRAGGHGSSQIRQMAERSSRAACSRTRESGRTQPWTLRFRVLLAEGAIRPRKRAANTRPATLGTVVAGRCGARVGRLQAVYALGGTLPAHKHGQDSVALAVVWDRNHTSWVPMVPLRSALRSRPPCGARGVLDLHRSPFCLWVGSETLYARVD